MFRLAYLLTVVVQCSAFYWLLTLFAVSLVFRGELAGLFFLYRSGRDFYRKCTCSLRATSRASRAVWPSASRRCCYTRRSPLWGLQSSQVHFCLGSLGLYCRAKTTLVDGGQTSCTKTRLKLCRTIVHQLHTASTHLQLPKPTLSDRRLMAMTHGMGHAIAQTVFLYFR